MYSPVHFYLTFNPKFNTYTDPSFTQAHEFYEYLKTRKKKDPQGYAYWGKVIHEDRDKKAEIDKMVSIIAENKKHEFSTHLYLTDFENVWVGKVEDVLEGIGKDFKTLEFYQGRKVEVWFKLSDFTLLEFKHDETTNKLSELYIDNSFMELKIDEISPFTSAIRYPAYVQDLADEAYFDQGEEGDLPLVLQDNPAINNTQALNVIKGLHLYAFPDNLYSKIPHSAKVEIESAELDMLEYRHHNLAKVAFSYIKALEVVINDLTIHHMKRNNMGAELFVQPRSMPPKIYLEDSEEGLITLEKFHKNFSIGQIVYLMQRLAKSNRLSFSRCYSKRKGFIKFMTEELPQILDENKILDIRGIIAHTDSSEVDPEDLMAVRGLILGIGHQGLIHMAYQNFDNDYKKIAKVMGVYKTKSEPGTKNAPPKRHLKIA